VDMLRLGPVRQSWRERRLCSCMAGQRPLCRIIERFHRLRVGGWGWNPRRVSRCARELTTRGDSQGDHVGESQRRYDDARAAEELSQVSCFPESPGVKMGRGLVAVLKTIVLLRWGVKMAHQLRTRSSAASGRGCRTRR
jgi:hypothetical protein